MLTKFDPGSLFTKRTDVLPRDLVESLEAARFHFPHDGGFHTKILRDWTVEILYDFENYLCIIDWTLQFQVFIVICLNVKHHFKSTSKNGFQWGIVREWPLSDRHKQFFGRLSLIDCSHILQHYHTSTGEVTWEYGKCITWTQFAMGPIWLTWLILTPAWINNPMPSKVWDEITQPFPNFNSATEVWEWINTFNSHFIMQVITCPCWD